jgi:carbonic anhydrase/acetyltransferase-like protein (isoleucine patch superfamily)
MDSGVESAAAEPFVMPELSTLCRRSVPSGERPKQSVKVPPTSIQNCQGDAKFLVVIRKSVAEDDLGIKCRSSTTRPQRTEMPPRLATDSSRGDNSSQRVSSNRAFSQAEAPAMAERADDDRCTTFRPEQAHPSVYLAPGAVVVGDVTLGEYASVWFNAVIRGDTEAIRIGRRTNIQDGAILHADEGLPCVLGDDVTVGHAAVVHGATVGDRVIVGIKSVVLNGVRIGEESVIAAGAVVPEGMEIPAGSLVMGVPAKIRGQVTDEHRERIRHAAAHYVENAKRFRG